MKVMCRVIVGLPVLLLDCCASLAQQLFVARGGGLIPAVDRLPVAGFEPLYVCLPGSCFLLVVACLKRRT